MPIPAVVPGRQVAGDLDGHAARTALRALATGLFDAWDDGDMSTIGPMFASDGAAAELEAWRAWEPWSIHWLSNEQVIVAGASECHGTWLWLTASTIDGGQTPAWAGGDLSVTAVWTASGWRIESLTKADRFRTPYEKGWLAVPTVATPLTDGLTLGVTSSRTAAATPTPTTATIADLEAEVDLRTLIGELTDDLETGRSPATVAARWTADGSLVRLRSGDRASAQGPVAIEAALDAQQSEIATYMRMVFSQVIEVHGDRAECRWRDLWCGVRDGAAVWVSHRYVLDAVRAIGGWQLERLQQYRVLDCAYDDGWPASGSVAEAPA